MAGILDELSCFCFPYECKFLELDVVNYIEDMESSNRRCYLSNLHGMGRETIGIKGLQSPAA